MLVARAESGWAVGVSPLLDPALQALIRACTAVDPAARPTAAGAGAALRNLSAAAVTWGAAPKGGAAGAGADPLTADVNDATR